MAIYRLEAKIFSRDNRGRSVIAAAAYRAGVKLKDELRDKIFDYSRKAKGVLDSTILTPEAAPAWSHDTNALWNKVEAGEKRKDAQLAREIVLAVPKELSKEAQFELAVGWAKKELVAKGMIAELSLHHPRGSKNPHVHILCTMRKLDGEQFSKKKSREWNDVGLLEQQRKSWADAVNAALEKAGRPERVDHRSLKDQGSDRIPEPKIGAAATAMKRKGTLEDPDRFKLVRKIKLFNEMLPWMRAMKKHGEIKQIGMGPRLWDRSMIFMSQLQKRASGMVKNTWSKLLDSRRSNRDKNEPENTR